MRADLNYACNNSVAFTIPSFTKLRNAERYHMAILFVEFHPERRRNVEITGMVSFPLLNEV
jgi:hypothetical protein